MDKSNMQHYEDGTVCLTNKRYNELLDCEKMVTMLAQKYFDEVLKQKKRYEEEHAMAMDLCRRWKHVEQNNG